MVFADSKRFRDKGAEDIKVEPRVLVTEERKMWYDSWKWRISKGEWMGWEVEGWVERQHGGGGMIDPAFQIDQF